MTATWAPPVTTTAFTIAESLLNLTRTAAAGLGIVLPDRQFVYMSPVVFDCDLAAVLVEGWYPNPPLGDALVRCYDFTWVWRGTIVIVRDSCAIAPKGKVMPTPEMMTQATRVASDDAEILRAVVQGLPEGGTLEINLKPPAGKLQAAELNLMLRGDGTLI